MITLPKLVLAFRFSFLFFFPFLFLLCSLFFFLPFSLLPFYFFSSFPSLFYFCSHFFFSYVKQRFDMREDNGDAKMLFTMSALQLFVRCHFLNQTWYSLGREHNYPAHLEMMLIGTDHFWQSLDDLAIVRTTKTISQECGKERSSGYGLPNMLEIRVFGNTCRELLVIVLSTKESWMGTSRAEPQWKKLDDWCKEKRRKGFTNDEWANYADVSNRYFQRVRSIHRKCNNIQALSTVSAEYTQNSPGMMLPKSHFDIDHSIIMSPLQRLKRRERCHRCRAIGNAPGAVNESCWEFVVQSEEFCQNFQGPACAEFESCRDSQKVWKHVGNWKIIKFF